MNSNFNRQFLMIDFDLYDDPNFVEFVKSKERVTYELLRRHIWRGGEKMIRDFDLRQLYEQRRLLASTIDHPTLAEILKLKDVTWVSKQLTKLEKNFGVIRRIRTGRQNIYVLGYWIDISEEQDGSKRVEIFYLDQKFGKKSDLVSDAKSDLEKNPNQIWSKTPNQGVIWSKTPNHKDRHYKGNITVNGNGNFNNTVNRLVESDLANSPNQPREKGDHQQPTTVDQPPVASPGGMTPVGTALRKYWSEGNPGNGAQSPAGNLSKITHTSKKASGLAALKQLPDLGLELGHIDYIASQVILGAYPDDTKSLSAFKLIAKYVPETIIHQTISAIKDDDGEPARDPVKLFMHRIKEWAKQRLTKQQQEGVP